jgi:hypothetical protein
MFHHAGHAPAAGAVIPHQLLEPLVNNGDDNAAAGQEGAAAELRQDAATFVTSWAFWRYMQCQVAINLLHLRK